MVLDSVKTFINRGSKRSIDAKKNIAASFLIKGISVLINLALVPLTIKYVNASQYGIWLTLSSIISWFSFFDIGFGNGLRNRYSEAKALGDMEKARIYVSTTYAALLIIFFSVWLLFFVANIFIDWTKLLNTPSGMAGELSNLALIVFSFFCLQMVLKTITTVITADQKPAIASLFDMLAQLISLIIIFILTHSEGGSLIYLGIVLGSAPVIILMIASVWFYNKQYRLVAPSVKYIRFEFIRDISKLGFNFFFIQISFILIYQTNNIIIAQLGNPNDVTVFNIAYKYLGIVLMVFIIIISPMWSAFTDAYTKSDFLWMRSTVSYLRTISYLVIIPVVILVLLADIFYKFWIGKSVTVPMNVTVIVAVYITVLCSVSLNTHILNGTGKIKLQLLTYSGAIIFHIPSAIILGKNFGVSGVIASASFFFLIIALFASRQVDLIINNKDKGIWSR